MYNIMDKYCDLYSCSYVAIVSCFGDARNNNIEIQYDQN